MDDAKETQEGGYEGTRNYEKKGGSNARNKDFDKFKGKETDYPAKDLKVKILPDGTKIISRDQTGEGIVPTIEIQDPINPHPKIKIRYR